MKLLSLYRLQHRAVIAAAALGFCALAAPAAQAFTIEDQSTVTNSDGTAKFANPGAPVTRFGNGGQTTIQQGNGTFQFGPQRPLNDERYTKDRMFDPLGRPGEDR
jgi:hypothetical protein